MALEFILFRGNSPCILTWVRKNFLLLFFKCVFPPIHYWKATFRRHEDLCNAQPCQSCTTGSTATPRRRKLSAHQGEEFHLLEKFWLKAYQVHLPSGQQLPPPSSHSGLGSKAFQNPAGNDLAAPPGQKVPLVMSALPGEGEGGYGTRTRPTAQSRDCRESRNVEMGISLTPREWREQGPHRTRGRTGVQAQRGTQGGGAAYPRHLPPLLLP